MKKVIIVLMAALLMGGLAGCYDDKGNYDYTDINEMTYTIKAAIKGGNEIAIDTFGYSRCKQSPEDVVVVYTSVVRQSMLSGEENIAYEWRVTNKDEERVVYRGSKELELPFPKNTASEYNITFCVTDSTTNVSFYKDLRIKTVQPYLNSWFVLNGEDGECQLSVVEEPDSAQYVVSYDGYGDLGLFNGEERKVIREANCLIYSSNLDESDENAELLQIVTKEGIWKMKPNTLTMKAMRLDSELSMTARMEGSAKSPGTVVADERGQLYKSVDGVSYEMLFSKSDNYHADVISHNLGEKTKVVFWDNEKKRFGYAEAFRGSPEVSFIESEIEDAENQEIVWIGPEFGKGNKENKSLCMAVGRNKTTQEYTVYHITEDEKNEYVITPQNIGLLKGAPSGFVSSPYAWERQFFYISGNSIYRFNGLDESIEIYDAGNPIRQAKFRILCHDLGSERDDEARVLGLAVEGADGWELHQISLTTGGDLEEDKVKVFGGFGPIKDFCFSFRNTTAE